MIALACWLALAAAPSADYPNATLVPIGGQAAMLGQRQLMAYFATADAPATVAERLWLRWRAQGFLAFVHADPFTGAFAVAAFCAEDGVMTIAVAQRSAPGRTLALVARRALWDRSAVGLKR